MLSYNKLEDMNDEEILEYIEDSGITRNQLFDDVLNYFTTDQIKAFLLNYITDWDLASVEDDDDDDESGDDDDE